MNDQELFLRLKDPAYRNRVVGLVGTYILQAMGGELGFELARKLAEIPKSHTAVSDGYIEEMGAAIRGAVLDWAREELRKQS